jgi:hypothetical protein
LVPFYVISVECAVRLECRQVELFGDGGEEEQDGRDPVRFGDRGGAVDQRDPGDRDGVGVVGGLETRVAVGEVGSVGAESVKTRVEAVIEDVLLARSEHDLTGHCEGVVDQLGTVGVDESAVAAVGGKDFGAGVDREVITAVGGGGGA